VEKHIREPCHCSIRSPSPRAFLVHFHSPGRQGDRINADAICLSSRLGYDDVWLDYCALPEHMAPVSAGRTPARCAQARADGLRIGECASPPRYIDTSVSRAGAFGGGTSGGKYRITQFARCAVDQCSETEYDCQSLEELCRPEDVATSNTIRHENRLLSRGGVCPMSGFWALSLFCISLCTSTIMATVTTH
jgi:hypothetical protein